MSINYGASSFSPNITARLQEAVSELQVQQLVQELKDACSEDSDSGYGSGSDDGDIGDTSALNLLPLNIKKPETGIKRADTTTQDAKPDSQVKDKAADPAPAPAAAAAPKTDPKQLSGDKLQDAINGDTSDLPSPDEQAPINPKTGKQYTVDEINQLSGGLLGKTGNQDLQGKGGIRDLLKKDKNVNGDIDNDPNAAWRAYRVEVAVKNEPNADGTPKPGAKGTPEYGTDKDVVHNGKIGGFTSSGDAAGGTEAGSLQDYLLHGRTPSKLEDQRDPHAGVNGQGANSEAEVIGKKIKYAFEDFGKAIVDGFKKVGEAFKNLGLDIWHGLQHFGGMVKHGLTGVWDSITGKGDKAQEEYSQARDNGKKLGHDIVDGAKQVGTIAEEMAPMALDLIPVGGAALSAGAFAAKTAAEAAIKAGTAVAKEGAKQIGKDVAKGVGQQYYDNDKGGDNQV